MLRRLWWVLAVLACDDDPAMVPADAAPEMMVDAQVPLDAAPDAAAPDWGAFEAFAPAAARPVDERLCPASADPEAAPDKVFIECALDGAAYAEPAAPTRAVRVVAYNIERGYGVDAQLARLIDEAPDVVLLSEADRGCARTDRRHVTDEYARALGMNYAYATEFVELKADGACEHGNAVLSRYPLGNVRAIRHATNQSWYDDSGEPRLGGRVAVAADVDLGEGRRLRVYALHLESAIDQATRAAQAAEIAADAPAWPTVAGGDLNSGLYAADLRQGTPVGSMADAVVAAFLRAGWTDAHAGLAIDDRITHPSPLPFVLDLVLGHGALTFESAWVGDASWDPLSDHRPVAVTVLVD